MSREFRRNQSGAFQEPVTKWKFGNEKGIVELHQGNIAVKSPGPGLGSEFRVVIPCSKANAPTHDAVQSSDYEMRQILMLDPRLQSKTYTGDVMTRHDRLLRNMH